MKINALKMRKVVCFVVVITSEVANLLAKAVGNFLAVPKTALEEVNEAIGGIVVEEGL